MAEETSPDISSYRYSAADKAVTIRFADGAVYRYFNVPVHLPIDLTHPS